MQELDDLPYDHLYLADYDAHLWILERAPRMLVLRWVQAGRCHYGEQRWVFVIARRAGTCALTKARIKVGDKICRPAAAISTLSDDVQILAEAIPCADADADDTARHFCASTPASGRARDNGACRASA